MWSMDIIYVPRTRGYTFKQSVRTPMCITQYNTINHTITIRKKGNWRVRSSIYLENHVIAAFVTNQSCCFRVVCPSQETMFAIYWYNCLNTTVFRQLTILWIMQYYTTVFNLKGKPRKRTLLTIVLALIGP